VSSTTSAPAVVPAVSPSPSTAAAACTGPGSLGC
jgi:hypothetical protein